jgi:stage IV sporulation protein A
MSKGDFFMADLYKDIQSRTNGEIYIGVVGPVRTGKSTFIKKFMELCVLPYMEDENQKNRTIDELPQSAQGKTIMTTEPKFIPQEAAEITLADQSRIRVRLIDCVGFMVEGANGHMEENGDRMVKTPWFSEEIPFVDAARIGTQKVIRDHATIGIVLTTDGTIGDIPRENYIEAEKNTIQEISQIKKPYVIVLNSLKPYSEETRQLAESMEQEYQAPVFPLNCKQMKVEDVSRILEGILYEFPVTRMDFFIPKWTEMLPMEHRIKQQLIRTAGEILGHVGKMRDVHGKVWNEHLSEQKDGEDYLKSIQVVSVMPDTGTVSLRMEVPESYYFENISEMTGVPIEGEYQMISMIRDLAAKRKEYEKVQEALLSVQQKGYGVVLPELSDISMEDPVLISHGNRFGVKMKAISPSIHMIRANVETEIAPIVGSREQAEDLIAYIKEGEESKEGIWTTNIFGKSLGDLMEDGIRTKITQMDDECQMKLQDTMQKIVNDSNGGMICIII